MIEHVQDRRQAAALRLPRERSCAGITAVYLQRPLVMACRRTGFAIGFNSVQEAEDMRARRYLSPLKSSDAVPALLRRLRTSPRDSEDRQRSLMRTWPSCSRPEKVAEFRARALNRITRPLAAPLQNRISALRPQAGNKCPNAVPAIVDRSWTGWQITGRPHKPLTTSGAPDASMSSVRWARLRRCDRGRQQAQRWEKVGLVRVHLYRSFSTPLRGRPSRQL